MKILIVGFGFVGKALKHILETNPDNRIDIVDPAYSDFTIAQSDTPSFAFVCVPTPEGSDGSCDYSLVAQVVGEIKAHHPTVYIVVKSTVTPDGVDRLLQIDPDLVYNPEFLTAANAQEDMRNSSFHLIGNNGEPGQVLSLLYWSTAMRKPVPHIYMSAKAAAFTKYAINSFLALKVAYFNELHAVAQSAGLDWEEIVLGIRQDPRVGISHTQVPGPDGSFGFGGACFPKDTQAFVKFAELNGTAPILATAIAENKKRRP